MLSVFSIIIFSFPSFATDPDIAANVTNPVCNSGVLDTDSGSVDLEIQWEPNTINVKWYNDTEENGATTPSTTNTCTYDGALTVPVAPAKKTGYTFAGWRLRQVAAPSCSFSNLAQYVVSNDNFTAYASKRLDNGAERDNYGGATAATYGLTEPGQWGVTFTNGMIIGISICSVTDDGKTLGGDDWHTGNPGTTGGGQYCWCRATGYTLTGESFCSVPESLWVYRWDDTHASWCANGCAYFCADAVKVSQDFREALFGL